MAKSEEQGLCMSYIFTGRVSALYCYNVREKIYSLDTLRIVAYQLLSAKHTSLEPLCVRISPRSSYSAYSYMDNRYMLLLQKIQMHQMNPPLIQQS